MIPPVDPQDVTTTIVVDLAPVLEGAGPASYRDLIDATRDSPETFYSLYRVVPNFPATELSTNDNPTHEHATPLLTRLLDSLTVEQRVELLSQLPLHLPFHISHSLTPSAPPKPPTQRRYQTRR